MAAKPKPFATEVDLCAAFLGALPAGWTAYNETAGWDILLVRDADGFQIGIQAKLKFNLAVLHQAIEAATGRYSQEAGPDCRAVLIPEGEGGLGALGAYLCLTVIEMRGTTRKHWQSAFEPELPDDKNGWRERWFELAPMRREKLPAYIPDCKAGDKAPLQLTEWKIKALKLAVLLERNGSVTREDFRHLDLDHRRWLSGQWLTLDFATNRWVKGQHYPDFAAQHPRNFAEISADAPNWMPKVMA
jgi:hypothetical protein